MAKYKHLAVTAAAKQAGQIALPGLTGHALTALQRDAARLVAKLSEDSSERSLRLVSTEGTFHAVIKHGKKVFQFEGDNFAVTTHD